MRTGRWRGVGLLLWVIIWAGCQSAGPLMPSDGMEVVQAAHPSEESPIRDLNPTTCMPTLVPDWVRRTNPLQGRSESTVSQEDADAQARKDLLKQLEVTITGKDQVVSTETTDKGFRYAITSENLETVHLNVSGVQVQERWINPCNGRYYALATLNRKQATDAWLHDLSEHAHKSSEFTYQAKALESEGQVFRALLALSRLMETQEIAAQIRRRVVFLSPEAASGAPDAGDVVSTRHRLETLLSSLQLRRESGDQQRPDLSGRLTQPLTVRLVAALPQGELPARDVPIQFVFELGQGEIEPNGRTDGQGRAQALVHRVEESDQNAQVMASLAVEQILSDFPKTFQDRLRGRFQAEAVRFVVLPAVARLEQDLGELAKKVDVLKKQVAEDKSRGNPFMWLASLHRLREAQEAVRERLHQLSEMAPKASRSVSKVGDPGETQKDIEAILVGLRVKKVGGDNQAAKLGRPLPEPLMARVVVDVPSGELPAVGIPVHFAFDPGKGELEEVARTDENGEATARVHRVEAGPSTEVVARLDLRDITIGLPPALLGQVKQRLGQEVVRFRITPPSTLTVNGPFDEALAQLANGLVERINKSYGKTGVVGKFVENRSQRRLSISQRIEAALASHLVQLNALQVVETAVLTRGETRSLDSPTENGPVAVVTGVYELDAGGGLWIEAKVVRLADQVMEATFPATIPRSALQESDIRELVTHQPVPAAIPLVPPTSPTKPVAEWVEALWNLRNPAGFETELVADKPTYRVGEKARFRFRTTKDCYLTVMNLGASGTLTQLVPNFERPHPAQTLVRRTMGWVQTPAKEDGFDFTVSAPVGTERIKAICTKSPVSLIENAKLGQGLFQLSPKEDFMTRDIQPTTKTMHPADWSAAHTQVVTLEANQTETRGMRGLRSLIPDRFEPKELSQ